GRGALLTLHSGLAPAYIRSNSNLRGILLKTALLPQAAVVCVNEEIHAALARFGYRHDKLALLPAFLFNELEIKPLPQAVSQVENFQPLISLVAFFRPEYGVELMIEALAALAQTYPQIGCVIMGSGEAAEALRLRAETCGVAHRIGWLGDLDHGQ